MSTTDTCPALWVMRGTMGTRDDGQIVQPRHVLPADGATCVHCGTSGVQGVRRD